jgi:ketosteroid isomerase-like protein
LLKQLSQHQKVVKPPPIAWLNALCDRNALRRRVAASRSLQQIEKTGDVEPLVALFAENADLINLAMHEPLQGKQHIRQFWQNYLSVFDRIQSRFTHVAEGDKTITLEWISEGALSSGEPFSYRGVSILETNNGQVQHFRTYYDSAAFLPEGAK